MKFKRTIASILAATFSLTLIWQGTPTTFARSNAEIGTKTAGNISEGELQKVKDPDEKDELEKLKEKIKKLEEKFNENEKGWSFKKGINAIKKSATSIVVFLAFMTVNNVLRDTLHVINGELDENEKHILDEKGTSSVLLNNIKSNKSTYFFNALSSTITTVIYRFTLA